MVQNQGGDISYLENLEKFPKAKYEIKIESKKSGIIKEINAEKIGELACYLGAGRIKKEDKIKNEVGIVLNKKVKEEVFKGEILATIFADDYEKAKIAKQRLQEIYKVEQKIYWKKKQKVL